MSKQRVRPNKFLVAGWLFMVLASLSRYVFRHTPGLPEDATDMISGLLYGVTIASLCVGVWLQRRRRSTPCG